MMRKLGSNFRIYFLEKEDWEQIINDVSYYITKSMVLSEANTKLNFKTVCYIAIGLEFNGVARAELDTLAYLVSQVDFGFNWAAIEAVIQDCREQLTENDLPQINLVQEVVHASIADAEDDLWPTTYEPNRRLEFTLDEL